MVLRVLIVDDEIISRVILNDIINKYGFEVIGKAENGQEAVTKFMQLKQDIVTMDIKMPQMDGLEALKIIRNLEPNCKIIICSAIDKKETIIKTLEFGANDFIMKPFIKDRIFEALQNIANTDEYSSIG